MLNITKQYVRKLHVRSILETKPTKNLPKHLIYFNRKLSHYTMFSTETGKVVGKMCARPEYIYGDKIYYPNMHGYSSLYIHSLKANIRKQGIGREFIKLAQRESVRRGCEGRVHLIADNVTGESDNLPYVAYRKMGFDSQQKWAIASIDRYIKTGDSMPKLLQKRLAMYLPVKNYCAKFNKLCEKLQKRS